MSLPERFLTLDEISDLLRVNRHTIYQQRWRGQPPGSLGVRVGHRVLFAWSDVEAWLDQCRTEQQQEKRVWRIR